MNIENMEQEFPKMPQSMRDMIEKEVEKQVKVTPQLAMKLSYLPDGMTETEEGKYSYEQTPGQGGISIVFYQMDTGDETFWMQDHYVTESENIQIGNHDGVYEKMQNIVEDDTAFDQRIYITYPEYHYVMQMYVGHDVTKEEACKVAEGIVLAPTEELADGTVISPYNWSDYEKTMAEDEALQTDATAEKIKDGSEDEALKTDAAAEDTGDGSEDEELKTTATAEEMKHLHKIGEEFAVTDGETQGLKIKVTDVKVTDDVAILDPVFLDRDMLDVDENGKLLPDTVSYIRSGDGVNTLDEVISSREVPRKLVYVTLEYTNAGETELKDVLFFDSVMKIREDNGVYEICGGEQPKEGNAWDTVQADSSSLAYSEEMAYYDVTGGERGNNYFDSIKAGETKILHVGFVVDEDALPYLYLNTSTSGCGYMFMEEDLEQGLVDIRQ